MSGVFAESYVNNHVAIRYYGQFLPNSATYEPAYVPSVRFAREKHGVTKV